MYGKRLRALREVSVHCVYVRAATKGCGSVVLEFKREHMHAGHKILERCHTLVQAIRPFSPFNFTRGSFPRPTDILTNHELCVFVGFPSSRIRHFLL